MINYTNMIVDIKEIESEALGAILAGMDALSLHELADVFSRWAFEREWDGSNQAPDLSQDYEEMVVRMLDLGCSRYIIRFDDREYKKQNIPDEVEEEAEDNDDDDDEDDEIPL